MDSFYFYDLETSDLSPVLGRIMQFAGQRTDLELNPLGAPDTFWVRITPDVLPSPDSVLVTGITPQQTLSLGVCEADFLRHVMTHAFTPGTIATGFNNIHFDDEFMRFALWRNFYDPYEWHWKEGRSRWDLLKVVRMARALRPQGIQWPVLADGTPSNRLEHLTRANGLAHEQAHDALSDVQATIALARLLLTRQPKLFHYLLKLRDKRQVSALIAQGRPLLHTSGSYLSAHEKSSVIAILAHHPRQKQVVWAYDLRVDPTAVIQATPAQLAELWAASTHKGTHPKGKKPPYCPIKTLALGRCPALAPLAVLDDESAARLQIDRAQMSAHFEQLKATHDLGDRLLSAHQLLHPETQAELLMGVDEQQVDGQLYQSFVPDTDRARLVTVRSAAPERLTAAHFQFEDRRLTALLPLYQARNYPQSLTPAAQQWWQRFCEQRLLKGGDPRSPADSPAARYFKRIQEKLAHTPHLTPRDLHLLESLKEYGESLLPNFTPPAL